MQEQMIRDKRKEMQTGHDDLQWFSYKDTFLVPTPLPESPTREFSSLLNKLPFGGENRTQLLLTPFNDTKLNVEF